MQISAAIITRNEERNIARAIESVRCCEEIVVMDSGSTDQTVEIAQRLGARTLHQDWLGYAAQKNAAAGACTHDWILSLDADEAVSEELEGEIWQLKRDGPRQVAYSMPRLAQYLGRWIRHSGWYPDRKIRLYDRRHARWEGRYVHESVRADQPAGLLQGRLLHYTCDSLSAHLATLDRYTTLAAREWIDAGRRPSWSKLWLNPPAAFVKSYLWHRGFLDGPQGLAIAWFAAMYVFLKYAKARRL